ncbi:MAG: siderophore-interacting protein [Burkholderiaceae bacterium]|jgi:NADPH-dependent ferric siderophore reductase|nr:siderophore-interacting protein [Burkholderiaceae bacterium]
MNSTAPVSASRPAAVVERVRHPFRARHVQLLAREQPSPGFVRLTLAGPDLHDFASAGFDDHVKLILPQEGRQLPALPVLLDGRPTFVEDERPTLRDYTPLRWDLGRQTLTLDFALHEAGPATEWALTAPVGQWLGLAGPRGSLVIAADLGWHWLFGDETAMPAIERRLAELPAGSRAVVRVQLRNREDQRPWHSAAALDCAWVDHLAEAVQDLQLPPGEGYVWAAGEHSAMAELRRLLLAKGVSPKRMRVASYWKQGMADHHEDLNDPS